MDDGVGVCSLSVYGVDASVGAASVWAPWDCRVPRRSDDCLFVRSVLGTWEAWDRVVACWRRVVVGVGVDLLAAIVTLFLIVCA